MGDQTTGKMSAWAGADSGSKAAANRSLQGAKSSAIQRKVFANKQRDRWLNRLTNEFLIVYRQFPFQGSLPEEKCPEWVRRIEDEYFRATHLGARLHKEKKFTAGGMGEFFGFQCAYAVWMMECFGAKIEDAIENPEKHKDLNLTKEERERGLNGFVRLNEWYGALRRLAGRALKSCVYQSYADMSAFLSAFSRAFTRKPETTNRIGDFESSAFGIYHFMLLQWRGIERLGSVRELHELLRKQIGEHRTGDLKRIEKICQRIDLHFGKPGRPKTPK